MWLIFNLLISLLGGLYFIAVTNSASDVIKNVIRPGPGETNFWVVEMIIAAELAINGGQDK